MAHLSKTMKCYTTHTDRLASSRPYTYATRYYYDESGNRVRKFTYINSQISPPPITDWNNPGNGWTLLNNEFYVKGVDGKDLATYQGNILDEWFVWGNDMVGKIKNDNAYYYYKDHLGSVRAVVNENAEIVAAYDYDAWGYPLEGREYNADSVKFKYTGKELDKESLYDYFGARYYDGRIGRWGQVEPLLEKYISNSPYQYGLCNPMKIIDIDGRIVVLNDKEKISYLARISNILIKNEINNAFAGLLSRIYNPENRSMIITENEDLTNLVAATGQIKYSLEGEKFQTDAIGISLSSDFFEIENDYIAAVLLEHELYHLDYYTKTLGFKTGTEVSNWQETNMKEFNKHELNAISHTKEKFKELYKSNKISKSEYKEAKNKLKEYEKILSSIIQNKYNLIYLQIFLLIFFLIFVDSSILHSQTWVYNNLANKFKRIQVYDIEPFDSDLWLITNKGIFSYNKAKIINYKLDSNSSGELKEFETEGISSDNYFTNLISNNNVLLISDENSNHILKISDSVVLNYKFLEYPRLTYNFMKFIYPDSDGKIWIGFTYFDMESKLEVSKIYKESENGFEQYFLDSKIDSSYLVNFFIKGDKKIFIFKENLNSNQYNIIVQKNDSILINRKIEITSYLKGFYMGKNELYIVNQEGFLFTIDKYNLTITNLNFKNVFHNVFSFYFLVENNNIVLVRRKMEFPFFDLGRSYCFSDFNSVVSCLL